MNKLEVEISKEMETKNKLEIKNKVEKVETKNKELCKKCPELLEQKLQESLKYERDNSEKEWQLAKLRETIVRMDKKYDQLVGESVEEKKRREWDKGLVQGIILGFSATMSIVLIICVFLSLFHVI